MPNKLVSIVMPIYNAEKYLKSALNCLKKQTYKNIEIICVDDGSNDGSVGIVEKFASEDKRFSLIRQQNQHAGIARNNGMRHASGEYLIFLDSDDLFSKNMIKDFYRAAEKTGADIVVSGYKFFIDGKYTKRKSKLKFKNRLVSPSEISDCILNYDSGAPWTKFFRTSFVKSTGLEFQGIKNTNDIYFTRLCSVLADKIYFLNKYPVYYRTENKMSLQGCKSKAYDCFYYAYTGIIDGIISRGLYETYGENLKKSIIGAVIYNLSASGDLEIFKRVLDMDRALFERAGITSDDEKFCDAQCVDVFKNILKGDCDETVFSLYEYFRNYGAKQTAEYKIGRIVMKIMGLR